MRGDLEKLVGSLDYVLPTWFWEKDEKNQRLIRLLTLVRAGEKKICAHAPLYMILYPFKDPSKARIISTSVVPVGEDGFVFDAVYLVRDEGFIDKIRKVMEEHVKRGCIDDYLIVKPQDGVVPNILLRRFVSPSGARMFVQYKAFFQGLFARTIKEHGRLGEMILEKLGENVAKTYAKTLVKKRVTSVERALKMVMITGSSLGLFRLKSFKVFRNPRFFIIQITLEDLFEEKIYREEGLSNKSVYELGFIKGLIKHLTGLKENEFTVTETKTIDYRDNRSVFVIKIPAEKLEQSL